MKIGGLAARVGKLEQVSAEVELPNGGIVLAVMADGETRDEAIERTFLTPQIQRLSASQRRKVIVIPVEKEDLGL